MATNEKTLTLCFYLRMLEEAWKHASADSWAFSWPIASRTVILPHENTVGPWDICPTTSMTFSWGERE